MRRLPTVVRFLLFFVLITCWAMLVQAQVGRPASIEPQDYGVQDWNYTFLAATDFRPMNSDTTYATDINLGWQIWPTGGVVTPSFTHEVNLPPGAYLEDVTAY